jgi:hypothetical protein
MHGVSYDRWAPPRPARLLLAGGLAATLAVTSGCQTAGGPMGGSGAWQIDSAASRCLASVVGGVLIGAAVGALTGRDNIAAGAAIGGIAGTTACAVITALDAQDRERIRQAQLAAAQSNTPQVMSYVGEDGLHRQITAAPIQTLLVSREPEHGHVTVESELPPAEADTITLGPNQEICRAVQTSASIGTRGTAAVPTQVICHRPDGTFTPETIVASR